MAARRTVQVALGGAPAAPRSVSPTSASAWRQCGLKYALSYLYGWQESGSLPQLVGNAAHRAVELLYGLHPADRTRPTASDLHRTAYREESAPDTFNVLKTRHPGLEQQVIAAGEDALDGLFDLEDPTLVTVSPEGLEVWVSADLYGAPVRGRIDRLYDASGAYVVADYKSGKVPAPAYTAKAFFGLWTYAAALAASDPDRVLPDRVELLYLIGRERLSRPVLRDVAIAQARELATIWQEIGDAHTAGKVAAQTGPLCNWCAFQPACPAFDKNAPGVGTDPHDTVLSGLGLRRRDRAAVSAALERAPTRAEAEGADDPAGPS
jgi:putative RecB family exonuclease